MTMKSVENNPQFYARLWGALYLLVIVFGAFAEGFVTDKLIVAGNVPASAQNIRLCRNKVERTKNAARVRKIKKLDYKTVQLWTKADLWRQVSFALCESYAWFQYPQ